MVWFFLLTESWSHNKSSPFSHSTKSPPMTTQASAFSLAVPSVATPFRRHRNPLTVRARGRIHSNAVHSLSHSFSTQLYTNRFPTLQLCVYVPQFFSYVFGLSLLRRPESVCGNAHLLNPEIRSFFLYVILGNFATLELGFGVEVRFVQI